MASSVASSARAVESSSGDEIYVVDSGNARVMLWQNGAALVVEDATDPFYPLAYGSPPVNGSALGTAAHGVDLFFDGDGNFFVDDPSQQHVEQCSVSPSVYEYSCQPVAASMR
jgi:hypothetical protein